MRALNLTFGNEKLNSITSSVNAKNCQQLLLFFVLQIIVNGFSLNVELENVCRTIQAIYLKLGVYLILFRGIENGTSFPCRVFTPTKSARHCNTKNTNVFSWSALGKLARTVILSYQKVLFSPYAWHCVSLQWKYSSMSN